MRVPLPDEAATVELAVDIAALVRVPDAILLSGDLGTGKTAFARAFIRAWTGESMIEVPSPTFTLVQPYESDRGPVWHFDLYRLGDPEELWEIGLEQAFGEAVCLIEWPDRLGTWAPRDRLEITLDLCDEGAAPGEAGSADTARYATLKGIGRWRERLEGLRG